MEVIYYFGALPLHTTPLIVYHVPKPAQYNSHKSRTPTAC